MLGTYSTYFMESCMKTGDLVRVQQLTGIHLGLLLVYNKWEKVAIVLVNGEVKRIRASAVTKTGRRHQEIVGGTL